MAARSYPIRETFTPNPTWTWHQYRAAYLKWMQKTNHPDLAKSNWYADKYRDQLKGDRK